MRKDVCTGDPLQGILRKRRDGGRYSPGKNANPIAGTAVSGNAPIKAGVKKSGQKTRKRGLFEKSPLLAPLKTFRQLMPDIGRMHPK